MPWDWDAFAEFLEQNVSIEGKAFSGPITNVDNLSGGCINDAYKFKSDGLGQEFFLKCNETHLLWMFEAEHDGLDAIHSCLANISFINSPQPYGYWIWGKRSILMSSWLDLTNQSPDKSSWLKLGKGLAQLHQNSAPTFGWNQGDNTIGSTPQPNPCIKNWLDFFKEFRLEHQMKLLLQKNLIIPEFDELISKVDDLFDDYMPKPSLIHGDLWNGNIGFAQSGQPSIFDPACYYADREAEFGIIDMFGGFAPEFFQGYDSIWTRDEGFDRRLPLYRLYHELNHTNIFGSSYLQSVNSTIREILHSI